jgi:ribonuclease BN (tRNA processing enzyme)
LKKKNSVNLESLPIVDITETTQDKDDFQLDGCLKIKPVVYKQTAEFEKGQMSEAFLANRLPSAFSSIDFSSEFEKVFEKANRSDFESNLVETKLLSWFSKTNDKKSDASRSVGNSEIKNLLKKIPFDYVAHPSTFVSYICQTPHFPGKFNKEKAQELGVPFGGLWGKLVEGYSIQLPDGSTVKPEDCLSGAEKSKVFMILNVPTSR